MLFEIAYVEEGDNSKGEIEFWKGTGETRRLVRGHTVPLFFNASVQRGVLSVPAGEYDRLYELESGNA